MRRAYDYWQNQPGCYLSHPSLPSSHRSGRRRNRNLIGCYQLRDCIQNDDQLHNLRICSLAQPFNSGATSFHHSKAMTREHRPRSQIKFDHCPLEAFRHKSRRNLRSMYPTISKSPCKALRQPIIKLMLTPIGRHDVQPSPNHPYWIR